MQVTVNKHDRQLVEVLRRAQWALDDAAHHIPTGRYPADRCTSLAESLEQLARILREHPTRTVIDSETTE